MANDSKTICARIKLRQGNDSYCNTFDGQANEETASVDHRPYLLVGEPIFNTDTNVLKIGDGKTAYNALPSYYLGATVKDIEFITTGIHKDKLKITKLLSNPSDKDRLEEINYIPISSFNSLNANEIHANSITVENNDGFFRVFNNGDVSLNGLRVYENISATNIIGRDENYDPSNINLNDGGLIVDTEGNVEINGELDVSGTISANEGIYSSNGFITSKDIISTEGDIYASEGNIYASSASINDTISATDITAETAQILDIYTSNIYGHEYGELSNFSINDGALLVDTDDRVYIKYQGNTICLQDALETLGYSPS